MFFRENEEESIKKVELALDAIRQGKMVVLTDNEDRENEGDLVIAAEKTRPEDINFMAKYGRGLICLTLLPSQVEKLNLKMMVTENNSLYNTAFTVSIEAREGVTTGISAADRSVTIHAAIDKHATPMSVISPGHIFPLKAQPGGVLVRTGQTEGSMDLSRLAGLDASGVICEIMNDDGTMARDQDLVKFCSDHNLVKLSVTDLVIYRLHKEPLINEIISNEVPFLVNGKEFQMKTKVFKSPLEHIELFSISMGEFTPEEPVLVRMHHGCPISDIFKIGLCKCGNILEKSIEMITTEGKGAVVYIESKKNRLSENFSDHILTGDHSDGFSGDQRYGLGAQVLKQLGIGKIKLITDHDYKISGIKPYGLEIVERVSPL
jgi:3,4-dihydroxy 2-butanone 4-phosphate synthase / GTP cyclohydrolase II